ncbi:hypothetical protein CANMA_005344 [Candida margitis]|uniref:uncharacterized protein n=1 Tax=Candida margitis TaxID=1775924 RepID=UPI0022277046|nr:uncharacterized protein CANMA_005344 [Candida margitis]KAI5950416.1 hypothetical protein CANMA_005344 [Candida margitis]
MHHNEDVISDSEDEITTFLEPFQPNRYQSSLQNLTKQEIEYNALATASGEDSGGVTDSDNVYFHMTQMQSIHESVIESERESQLQKKSILSLRSLRCSSSERMEEECKAPDPPKKKNKRKTTTGAKSKKKNQSMSHSVREVFESDKSKYFIAKQSRIDEFCARSKANNSSRSLQNRRLEQAGEKQLLSSTDWLRLLHSIKISFPRTRCLSEIQTNEDTQYRSLWDEASSNVQLDNEEMKILYNK